MDITKSVRLVPHGIEYRGARITADYCRISYNGPSVGLLLQAVRGGAVVFSAALPMGKRKAEALAMFARTTVKGFFNPKIDTDK